MDNRKTTYTGGCRCGQVRYAVELELGDGEGRCKCGDCKRTFCGALVKPNAFKLLTGEESLADYTFESRRVHHVFCKHCGTRSFCRGDIPEIGGAYVTVNLKLLDGFREAFDRAG